MRLPKGFGGHDIPYGQIGFGRLGWKRPSRSFVWNIDRDILQR
ncbi:MAG: hypothetical protein WC455_12105 [Dehalococcoidia bacterium]